jgi:hypothetical protein
MFHFCLGDYEPGIASEELVHFPYLAAVPNQVTPLFNDWLFAQFQK